ncbi:SAM-dependent methyltransferase [Nonomuraea phyllanthi]|uniref:SAM-dependent methyltransferase n=1 Tax=Nonomuraea phyllanthi TaxID=2219224 RepID=A0A5C4V7S5_9ACTN|nr:SAM-dependent methyltransferase [Nonomuraea phyllanthi]KAB8187498.1 SAM-dependent methyltransferase [Nonomuraea phyllanthi]QFY07072.1 SAM-dependent methyltransferase [Nonomuraea phyllanthi]
MPRYALLILPAFNRVYGESSVRLTRSELAVFSERGLGGKVRDSEETVIGGVPYVTFEAATPLEQSDISLLSNLSAVYAVFGMEGDLLRPLTMRPLDRLSSDLITIQKYAGKTNEHFTKLLLNVTALAGEKGLGERLAVFDPLCGRGTTLNQALMYGYDAYGLDVDGKDFEAYAGFIKTWLRNKRLKHTAETVPVRRDRALLGRRLNVTFGLSKEAVKAGDVQHLAVVSADTLKSREFFRPRSFDVVVADAPYGVQHGSKGGSGLSRSPLELLRQAVPVWAELLRPGGAMGIAWNTYGGKSADLAEILRAAGLEVLDYPGFEHRVDQAIVRDIIVARRPR